MINTLEEAWLWYAGARRLAQVTQRLGTKYWDDLPADGPLNRDNLLRDLKGEWLADESDRVLADLNDLCVFLLFAVFEAVVRKQALEDVEAQLATLTHPILRHAALDMREAVRKGPLLKVLEAYKPADPSLVEEVNQVRRYRNWVAHGRQQKPPGTVTPDVAHGRLQRFLELLTALAARFPPPGVG